MEKARQEERRLASEKRSQDHRTPFERDLARLIHSAAFRRLQSKTQVLGIGEGDFHRTRLTHSMETAQIGRGIVKNLKYRINTVPQLNAVKYLPDSDLITCICLAHDLGHPPFGHGGETALNYCMRNCGGFEANAQTLRILSKIEAYLYKLGLNLTRRSMLGVLKYPANYKSICRLKLLSDTNRENVKKSDWKPPKCYYDQDKEIFEWIIKPFSMEDRDNFQQVEPPTDNERGATKEKSLDTSIMELSDDIEYGVHDLDDAIALRLIEESMWDEIEKKFDKTWKNKYGLDGITKELFSDSRDSSDKRKRAIGSLVHAFITSSMIEENNFNDPLLKYRVVLLPTAKNALNELKGLITNKVINIPEVQTLEYRGQQIVMQLFEAINSDPDRLLKKNFLLLYREGKNDDEKIRVICDYISGMTDDYATRLYERLFLPRHGTVFQRL